MPEKKYHLEKEIKQLSVEACDGWEIVRAREKKKKKAEKYLPRLLSFQRISRISPSVISTSVCFSIFSHPSDRKQDRAAADQRFAFSDRHARITLETHYTFFLPPPLSPRFSCLFLSFCLSLFPLLYLSFYLDLLHFSVIIISLFFSRRVSGNVTARYPFFSFFFYNLESLQNTKLIVAWKNCQERSRFCLALFCNYQGYP